jgi:hypothetical protein
MRLESGKESVALYRQTAIFGNVLGNADDADDLSLFRDRIAPDPNPPHGSIGSQNAALRINVAGSIHGGVDTPHHFLIQGMNSFHKGVWVVDKALTGATPYLFIPWADVEDLGFPGVNHPEDLLNVRRQFLDPLLAVPALATSEATIARMQTSAPLLNTGLIFTPRNSPILGTTNSGASGTANWQHSRRGAAVILGVLLRLDRVENFAHLLGQCHRCKRLG